MLTIDKNVRIPSVSRPGRKPKYPWRTMDVGDSFFVPSKTPCKLSGSMQGAKKRLGRNFTARAVEGGVRVWRTE